LRRLDFNPNHIIRHNIIPEITDIVYNNREVVESSRDRSRIDNSSELGTIETGNALTTRGS